MNNKFTVLIQDFPKNLGDESRPVLENLVLETFEEMQMLQTDGIELDGKKYSIKWYFKFV